MSGEVTCGGGVQSKTQRRRERFRGSMLGGEGGGDTWRDLIIGFAFIWLLSGFGIVFSLMQIERSFPRLS